MPPSKTWKNQERSICREFFGVERNPLSGANSRHDDGTPRPGDCLYPNALIEIKYRKVISSIKRAMKTRDEANKLKVPFVHIERMYYSDLYNITVTEELAKIAIGSIKTYLERGQSSEHLKTEVSTESEQPQPSDGKGNG